ncbi:MULTISPECIES: ABC transporter ATP-binding protein [unclassified Paenibacillus]|uniref:ABC transporter ATP-binding protein n=1 Tax=unclassified Paenibacillus TaxID=185978 RepID=UPI002406486A|nr:MULTISPECIES: ABC transporter ATP-binding protein [unclassified Paenibacillus]MDF9839755.1 NitT/TauT family transport system ATP-binding protein [Paenibacillus sp. PastF-2]MDF9846335.1 NitT/TauT family transport system ATP-binding protein [Paenibacillus sp. PastM-2]MDF9853315.1 NitT/TauT family transport system ATP-binding protein [Paenibacillus sp. PastF-1]MDH6478181.1 NitT/TauT family transport system ATP-binding protein [Paenibacillus sp. PastH-2]MDH6506320.1 NitT/TauT family transport s
MSTAPMSKPQSYKLVAEHVGIQYRVKRTGENLQAVRDVSFQIKPEEFVCIVGPSGCGKSTFLNAVAGLMPHNRGQLVLDGTKISGPGKDRAVVFQSPALLPWRTVVGNVKYGLELRGTDKQTMMDKSMEMIKLVGLSGHEHKYPNELSGGMQQRVNLARALASDPELLLLDEPFSALDAQTREVMQNELLRIWQETRKTAMFITHQIDEAVFLADRVIVLSKGPGSVVSADIEINLPRPRNEASKADPEFLSKVAQIRQLILH